MYENKGIYLLLKRDQGNDLDRRIRLLTGDGVVSFTHIYAALRDKESDKLDEALAKANKAVETTPDLVWAHITRARILRANGEKDKAMADLQKAVELDDRSSSGYNLIGEIFGEQGRMKGRWRHTRKPST